MSTNIEWTATVHPDGTVTKGETWNPVTGCSKVSPGCAHCYAETVALRFWPSQYVHTVERGFISVKDYSGDRMTGTPRQFTDVMCHEDRLDQPLRWRKPRRVFVNSMSDLFHEDVPDAFIDKVFAVMALAPRHTFQVLTKRAERMQRYLADREGAIRDTAAFEADTLGAGKAAVALGGEWESPQIGDYGRVELRGYFHGIGFKWPLPNVWLGVSVENQRFADKRIPLLLQTPAAVRFISAEPLLGPLFGLDQWLGEGADNRPFWTAHFPLDERGFAHIPGLDWVIVGGESGSKARPFDLAWARSIVQQCQAAGVPVFVKQLGYHPTTSTAEAWSTEALNIRDKKGGDPEEWPEDLRIREFPREEADVAAAR